MYNFTPFIDKILYTVKYVKPTNMLEYLRSLQYNCNKIVYSCEFYQAYSTFRNCVFQIRHKNN